MGQHSAASVVEWEARAAKGGEVVGPVSLDTVQRWFEAKSLDSKAQVRLSGTTEWQLATDALRAESESRPPTGPTPKIPAAPQRPRRRYKLAFMAMAALVLTAAALGGAAYRYKWLGRFRDTRSLPIAAARLPNRTIAVAEGRLQPNLDEFADLPAEYSASALAETACGGVDLAALLQGARGKDLGWQQGQGLLDLLQKDTWQEALVCGEALRRSMLDPKVGQVFFSDGEKLFDVSLLRTVAADLVGKRWTHHTFSGFPGQCETPKEANTACVPTGRASFYDAPLRVVGTLDAIEAFARTYTSARDELSTSGEILSELIALTGRSDETFLSAKPEHVDFADVCRRAAPVAGAEAFMKACFPDGQSTVIASIETKVRGLATERDFITKSRYRWAKVLLARDEEAAVSIEKDLLDLSRDWRSHLENNESTLIKLYREPSTFIHDDLMRAALDPFLRGLRGMKVNRSGKVVRLVVDEELRPAESKVIREFTDTRREDQVASIKVVEALRSKAPVPIDSLAVFVGPAAALWITAPRATKEDCAALATKLAAVSQGEVPPELFGTKFRLARQFKEVQCVGQALPAEIKVCFSSAASLAAFAKCKLPEAPFVVSAKEKLQGQWKLRINEHVDAEERTFLETVKLEISETKAIFSCAKGVWSAPLVVESTRVGAGSMAFPLANITPHEFAFAEDGAFVLKNFVPGMDVTFEHAKFDPLLAADSPKGVAAL